MATTLEAMGWVLPYHLATSDVLLAISPASEPGWLRQRREALQRVLGMESAPQRERALARLRDAYAELFAEAHKLAGASSASNSQVAPDRR